MPVVAYEVPHYLWLLIQRNEGEGTEVARTYRPVQARVLVWLALSMTTLGAT